MLSDFIEVKSKLKTTELGIPIATGLLENLILEISVIEDSFLLTSIAEKSNTKNK